MEDQFIGLMIMVGWTRLQQEGWREVDKNRFLGD